MTVLIPKLSTQDSAHRAARVNQPDQVLNPSAGRRRMLNARRAAEYCGVSKSFLDKARCTGYGAPLHKIGRRCLYDAADLNAWLAEQKRRSTSDSEVC